MFILNKKLFFLYDMYYFFIVRHEYLISCSWLISLHCIPSSVVDHVNILSVAYGLFLSTVFHQISYQLLMAYFSPLYSIKCGRPCEYLISCSWLISLHCIPSNILSVAYGLFLSTVFHQISYQLLMAYFSPLYSIKCGRPWSDQTKDYKFGICFFSALRSKSKDCLT